MWAIPYLVYFPWVLFVSAASAWPSLQVHSGSFTSLKSAVFVSLKLNRLS